MFGYIETPPVRTDDGRVRLFQIVFEALRADFFHGA